MTTFDLDLSKYQLGWNDEVEYAFDPVKGLNQGVVEQISWWKGEPRWMTEFRLRSLRLFDRKPMAEWFATNMPDIDFQDIYYYLKPAGEQVDEWDELPEEMMRTYEKLGIPLDRQGDVTGTLGFWTEVVQILLFVAVGVVACACACARSFARRATRMSHTRSCEQALRSASMPTGKRASVCAFIMQESRAR